jgi:hypothetical protein
VSFDGTLRSQLQWLVTSRHSYASFSRRRYCLFCQRTENIYLQLFNLQKKIKVKQKIAQYQG